MGLTNLLMKIAGKDPDGNVKGVRVDSEGNVKTQLLANNIDDSDNPMPITALEDDNGKGVLRVVDASPFAYDSGKDIIKVENFKSEHVSYSAYVNTVIPTGESLSLGIFPILRRNTRVYLYGFASATWKVKVDCFLIAGDHVSSSSHVIRGAEIGNYPNVTLVSGNIMTMDFPLTGAEFKITITHTHGSNRTLTLARVVQID